MMIITTVPSILSWQSIHCHSKKIINFSKTQIKDIFMNPHDRIDCCNKSK